MKKKIYSLLLICLVAFTTCACACQKEGLKQIEYTHYVRGGGKETLDATILWEFSNDTFTKYQVAYTSYVCSDPSVNYMNVIYLEITNRGTKDEALIRNISFSTIEGNNEDFNVGLWGDYKSHLNKDFYTGIENELLPKLKYMDYETITSLANEGYRNYTHIEDIDADAISHGTISASNIVSIVKAIFDYHIDNHY